MKQFLKGAAKLRPSPVHRYPTWDRPKVLPAVTKSPFEPIRTISMQFLMMKVAFLIAITSVRRISELGALSVAEGLCTFYKDRVVLRLDPSFTPKVGSCFHWSQEIVLPNFRPSPRRPLEHRWHKLNVR